MRNQLRKILTHSSGAIYAWWQKPHSGAVSDQHSDLVFGSLLRWAREPHRRCGHDPQKKYNCAGPGGVCARVTSARYHRHYLFGPPGWSGDSTRNSHEQDFIGFRIDLLKKPRVQFDPHAEPINFLAIAHEMAHERSRNCEPVKGAKRPRTVWGFEYEAERECVDIQRSDNRNHRILRMIASIMSASLRIPCSSILEMSAAARLLVMSTIIWMGVAAWKLGLVSDRIIDILRSLPSDFMNQWQLKNGSDFVSLTLIFFVAIVLLRKSVWGILQSVNYREEFRCLS